MFNTKNTVKTFTLTLLVAFFSFAAPITIVAQSKSEINNAINLLNQLKTEINKMQSSTKTSLGPYDLKAKYKWCSERAWWGFSACTKYTTETCSGTANFNWTKRSLVSTLSNAERETNKFAPSFEPTKRWLASLPQFTSKFSQNAKLIEDVGNQISNGNGPTEDQRRRVTTALQQLVNDLNSSSKQLQQGVRALAQFLDRISENRVAIKRTLDSQSSRQQKELERLKADFRKTCKHGTFDKLSSQFSNIQNQFNASTAKIKSAFQGLESTSIRAEKAVASIVSFVVSNNSNLGSILENVKSAKTAELGSWIQQMDLGIAQDQWAKIGK